MICKPSPFLTFSFESKQDACRPGLIDHHPVGPSSSNFSSILKIEPIKLLPTYLRQQGISTRAMEAGGGARAKFSCIQTQHRIREECTDQENGIGCQYQW
jgi:hypothetical protein